MVVGGRCFKCEEDAWFLIGAAAIIFIEDMVRI